jgi:predicted Zn-dependent protease with MMP-like domain
MLTIDEVETLLDEVAGEIPQEFYRELNGGVNLLEDVKLHSAAVDGDLYILGDYHRDAMGRQIYIYYGSLLRNYPHYTAEQMKERLRRLLIHEFTHHLESLAGERGLEIKDGIEMEKYKKLHDI